MGFRLLASFGLVLALLTPAAGQPPDPTDESATAAARALFAEGVSAAEAGDHATAVDRFERALALRWAPPIAYNLAEALAQVGRYVEAVEQLHSVERAEAPADMQANARLRREELEPRLGRLRVNVTGSGVRVRVDARELPDAMIGVGVPADPGDHVVTLWQDGHEVDRALVRVVSGAEATVRLEPTVAPDRVDPDPLDPEVVAAEEARRLAEEDARRAAVAPNGARRRRVAVTLGVVGALVVAGGIVLALALRPDPAPRVNGDFEPGRFVGRVEGVVP